MFGLETMVALIIGSGKAKFRRKRKGAFEEVTDCWTLNRGKGLSRGPTV